MLFWVLREQSYTGDWKNWTRFIEEGLWYRLREPICLLIYQIPYGVSGIFFGHVEHYSVMSLGCFAYLCGDVE